MAFDLVHDVQQAYRRVVYANSFPGRAVNLLDVAARIEPSPPFNPSFMLLALMLLDGETTFAVRSEHRERDERIIAQRSYARVVPVDQAAFVFVAGPVDRDPECVRNARIGTLLDPHLGATLIIEVDSLHADADAEADHGLTIRGPGVDGESVVRVAADAWWLQARNERVKEFPLGVDLFLVDPAGNLVALPRTTRIGVSGDERPRGARASA